MSCKPDDFILALIIPPAQWVRMSYKGRLDSALVRSYQDIEQFTRQGKLHASFFPPLFLNLEPDQI